MPYGLQKRVASSVIALSVAILAGGTAQSQSSGQRASTDPLEEIIVTGLKRDQSFVDVPVSVQVFGEQEIVRAGNRIPSTRFNGMVRL